MSADRPFQPPFPGLVEALDEIDADPVPLGQGHQFAHEPRLIDLTGQRRPAHAPGRRPARLADEHRLAAELVAHPPPDPLDVRDRPVDADRLVLPIRQRVDGDEIDGVGHLRVLPPELPDVGVGHRNVDGVADATDHRRKLGGRLFAPQQDFVADDYRADGLGIPAGEIDDACELLFVLDVLVADPGAQHHLHPKVAGDPRHLVEPLVDGIRAHAAGHRRQMPEIVLDLLRR